MKKLKCLDSTTIKIIAVCLMVCDHIHQMFIGFGAPMWLSYLGRLVFPLFLFASADSFYYTHNRKKYLFRLLLASWIMTLLDLALPLALPNDNVVLTNNAFSTFFIAGLYMLFWDRLVCGVKERKVGKIATSILLFFIPFISAAPVLLVMQNIESIPPQYVKMAIGATLLIPNILMTEGGFAMVLLGLLFYIFRERRTLQVLVLLILSSLILLRGGSSGQWLMVFAAIPMLMYNGKKGKGMKWFFYIFYPAHIAILYIAATLLA